MITMTVQRGIGTLLGVRSLRLQYRSWEASEAKAAVIIIHGLADHSGRYESLGSNFAEHGFSTFAFDLRGHGLSDGKRGHAITFDCFLQDLDRFRREVEGVLDRATPLFLLGMSMGGLIALRYLQEYETPLRGAIMVSPWLATALPVPRWKVMLGNAIGRVFPAVPFRAGIKAAALSRDPTVVSAYRQDPLVHDTITPRLFAEVSKAMGLVTQRSDRLTTPLLFLLPGADRIVDTERTVAFTRHLPASMVNVKVYPGHYHELLNEPDRIAILREVRDWIEQRIPVQR